MSKSSRFPSPILLFENDYEHSGDRMQALAMLKWSENMHRLTAVRVTPFNTTG
jgi:hypothetical protein